MQLAHVMRILVLAFFVLGTSVAIAESSGTQPSWQRLANDGSGQAPDKEKEAAAARKRELRSAEEAARRQSERATQRRLDEITTQQLLRGGAPP
jgi:hypothetical protein